MELNIQLCTQGGIKCFHVLFSPGDATGQLTGPPPTCPGGIFTFICTVTSDINGITIWRVNSSNSNLCVLSHILTGTISTCGTSHLFTAISETGFGANGPFTSTLSATADPVLDGTLVECFGPAATVDPGNKVGSSTIQIVG